MTSPNKKQPEQPTPGAAALGDDLEVRHEPSPSPVLDPNVLNAVADSINETVEENRPPQPPQRGVIQIDI